MKIMITGACGYLGSKLVPHLISLGHTVVCIDNCFYGQDPTGVLPTCDNFYKIDLNCLNFPVESSDRTRIINLLQEIDVLIPLHALVGAGVCQKHEDKAVETNLNSIAAIMSFLPPSVYVVGVNTNSSYGTQPTGTICTEETPTKSISLYAETKDGAEEIILSRGNSVVFRLATVHGVSPRQRLDLLVPFITYHAYFDKYIKLFDGDYERNFVHIQDVIDAFVFAINNRLNGVYNLGHDESNTTKMGLVEEVGRHLNFNVEVDTAQTDLDKRNYRVSSAKLASAGFTAQYDLSYGIKELMVYFSSLPRQTDEREQVIACMRNA